MSHALLFVLARVDDVSAGGPLTLIFPLVLVFIVAAIWTAWWMRRSRKL